LRELAVAAGVSEEDPVLRQELWLYSLRKAEVNLDLCQGTTSRKLNSDLCQGTTSSELNSDLCQGTTSNEVNPDLCQDTTSSELNPELCQGTTSCELNSDLCQGTTSSELNPELCQGTTSCELNPELCQGTTSCELNPDSCQGTTSVVPNECSKIFSGLQAGACASTPNSNPLEDRLPFSTSLLPKEWRNRQSSIPVWPLNRLIRAWLLALRRRIGRATRLSLAEVVARPGEFIATRTHLEITFPQSALEVNIRKAGFDINPGWLSWLGRVVVFHYSCSVLNVIPTGGVRRSSPATAVLSRTRRARSVDEKSSQ
jgi:hypothetical protein